MKSIVLSGFMATGKSTIGPRLAARLGVPFVDTDAEIERAAGKSVPELWREEGEAAAAPAPRTICRRVNSTVFFLSQSGLSPHCSRTTPAAFGAGVRCANGAENFLTQSRTKLPDSRL